MILTNGDVDAIAGLLTLREGQPFTIYGSERVLGVLAGNNIFDVVDRCSRPERYRWRSGGPFAVEGPTGPTGIEVEAFPVPGKVPLYLEDASGRRRFRDPGRRHGRPEGDRDGDQAVLLLRAGLRQARRALRTRLAGAPLLFFDGTLYTNDEMIVQGLMNKTGDRIGHMNMSGERGHGRRLRRSRGRAQDLHPHQQFQPGPSRGFAWSGRRSRAAGWEVAYDGMAIKV